MPGYLYQEQFTPIPIYQSPLDLYGQALQVKDAKFKAGLANIRSKYDEILSQRVTNPENEMAIRNGVENAMNQLSKVSTLDVSLPENQGQIKGVFDNILNDEDIIYDIGWTRGLRGEINKAEQLQKTKPELVPDQNLEPLYTAQQQYANSPKSARPGLPHFTPYYDYNTKHNADLDKIKSDVDLIFANADPFGNFPHTVVTMADGSKVDLGTITDQRTRESIKAAKVNQLMWDKISSDPQALHQMQLDYSYNRNHGMFTPEAANQGLTQDLNLYKSTTDNISKVLASGTLNAEETQQAEKQLKYYNQEITRLTGLKNKINSGGDPTEYFTFGKTIKDYVESKALQYSHTKEGLYSAMPGYDVYLKGKFDLLQEQARVKAAADKAGKQEPIVETPVVDLFNSLIESPGGIKADDRDIAALAGLDKDGKYNLSFDNTDPTNRAIIVPANVTLGQDQLKDVKIGGILKSFDNELEALNINSLNQSTSVYAHAAPGGFVYNQHPASASEILNTYATNKNAYGEANATKIQAVIDKYKGQLASANIDPLDVTARNQAEQKVNDPTLTTAIAAGQDLANMHFKGQFPYLPDADTNVTLGTDQKIYMKGRFLIPYTQLQHSLSDRSIKGLIDQGIITREGTQKITGEDGKTAQEQIYGLHVYLPAAGKPEDINDRMLGARGLYYGSGKEDYQLRSQSKINATGFGHDIENAYRYGYNFKTQFDANGKPILPSTTGMGGTNSYDTEEMTNLRKIAGDIATETGQDSDQILNSIFGIIQQATPQGGSRNPVKIYEGIGALRNGLGLIGQASVENFMKGIAGPEGAGYGVGNAQSSAFGKYQITESTFEKIRELPNFPTIYKLDSFADFKTDPQLQDVAMATYSDYLLKKFQNPITAAVAFYTGEASEETKAFQENPTAAMEKYRNRTPSSGGLNTNLTIGAYLSSFLKSFR